MDNQVEQLLEIILIVSVDYIFEAYVAYVMKKTLKFRKNIPSSRSVSLVGSEDVDLR